MQFGGFGSTIFGPHFILLIWMFGSFFKRKNKKNREKYFSFFFYVGPFICISSFCCFSFFCGGAPFWFGCVGVQVCVCVCVCVCPPHLHIFVFFRRCPFLAWVCRCVCVCVCVCNRIELLRRPPSFVDIFVIFFGGFNGIIFLFVSFFGQRSVDRYSGRKETVFFSFRSSNLFSTFFFVLVSFIFTSDEAPNALKKTKKKGTH